MKPHGIFYTAVTGIWQTVWLEPVPETHISGLTITPDIDGGTLTVLPSVAGDARGATTAVTVKLGGTTVASAQGPAVEGARPRDRPARALVARTTPCSTTSDLAAEERASRWTP